MTEDEVHQQTDGKLPKAGAEKPLPAKRNKTIEEKREARFGSVAQVKDPQEFFPKLFLE